MLAGNPCGAGSGKHDALGPRPEPAPAHKKAAGGGPAAKPRSLRKRCQMSARANRFVARCWYASPAEILTYGYIGSGFCAACALRFTPLDDLPSASLPERENARGVRWSRHLISKPRP